MENLRFVSFLSGLTLLTYAAMTTSLELDGTFKKCRGVDVQIDKDHDQHVKECLKDAGVSKVLDLPPSQMPCAGKCIMSKKGLIQDNGIPDKNKIMVLVKENLPKEVYDDIDKRMEECVHPNSTEMIDPEDDSCASLIPTLMCIHISFMEACDVKE